MYTLIGPDWEFHYRTCSILAGRELTEEDKRLIREESFFHFKFVVQKTVTQTGNTLMVDMPLAQNLFDALYVKPSPVVEDKRMPQRP